jgi:hypothetical protein
VEVDASVPFNSYMISQMDIPWPIDDDSWFNVNILPIGSEEETIFDIGNWIPEPLLHLEVILSIKFLSKIFFISFQSLSIE